MEDISKIYQTRPITPDKQGRQKIGTKKNKKRKPFREVKKYLDEVTKIVEETHKELEEANSPFRLCVYQEGDDIYIDVVTFDERGNTTQVFRHDISHIEVEEIVHHIKSGTGLIFDTDA